MGKTGDLLLKEDLLSARGFLTAGFMINSLYRKPGTSCRADYSGWLAAENRVPGISSQIHTHKTGRQDGSS